MVKEIGQEHIFHIQFTKASHQGSDRFVVNDILDIQPTPEELITESSDVSNKDSIQIKNASDSTLLASTSDAQHKSEPIFDYTPATPNTPPGDVVHTSVETVPDKTKLMSPDIQKLNDNTALQKGPYRRTFPYKLTRSSIQELSFNYVISRVLQFGFRASHILNTMMYKG